DLQTQVNRVSAAGLENSLAIHQEAEQRRKDIAEAQDNFEYLCDKSARLEDEIEIEKNTRSEQVSEINEEIASEIRARSENDLGLARQSNANAEAGIQNALTLHEVSERRKADLHREERERIAYDADLQGQINETAKTSLENAFNLHQEAEQRRILGGRIEALEDAADLSGDNDEYHQAQIDSLVEANMQEALNLCNEAEHRRIAMTSESNARIESNADLQSQIDTESNAEIENALAVHQEAKQRRKDIAEEAQSRHAEDANQQVQTDTASAAIIQNAINLADEAQKRRQLAERLVEEIHDREREIQNLLIRIGELYEIPLPGIDEKFATLQKQADANAEASIENSVSIHAEAEQRRKITETLKDAILRSNQNGRINQEQIDTLACAIFETALNLKEGISRRRSAIVQETQARITGDADLQAQVDKASTAGIENSLALQREAEQRREAINNETRKLIDYADSSQSQFGKISGAVIENALSIAKSNEKRRTEDNEERRTRYAEDGNLQGQINKLAETCMRIMASTAETQAKINEIAKAAEAISGTTGVASDTEVEEMLDEIYDS
ncbi:MAG: hypothetical protein IJ587_12380, partial [Synergistaceae bacterium]|nr:hypothetical protein [Synergistaceae bacterium]